jgi:hypothetical protein
VKAPSCKTCSSTRNVKLIRVDTPEPPPVLILRAEFGMGKVDIAHKTVEDNTPIDLTKGLEDVPTSLKRKKTARNQLTEKGHDDLPDTRGFVLDPVISFAGTEYENVGAILCSPGHFSPLIRYAGRFYNPKLITSIPKGAPYVFDKQGLVPTILCYVRRDAGNANMAFNS